MRGRVFVLVVLVACKHAATADHNSDCKAIAAHLDQLAAGKSDLERGAAKGWAQDCNDYTPEERRCLADSTTQAAAYSCLSARIERRLQAAAPSAPPAADPECVALWQHRLDLFVADDHGTVWSSRADAERDLAPTRDQLLQACPRYAKPRRACMRAATSGSAFLVCQ
jgi:hypothetical protein